MMSIPDMHVFALRAGVRGSSNCKDKDQPNL